MMSSLFLLVLGLIASTLASPFFIPRDTPPGALRMPFTVKRGQSGLSKREDVAGTVGSQISNVVETLGGYTIYVTAGTPPQSVSLIIDTGSTDTWMFAPDSCSVANEDEGPESEEPPSGAAGCGGGC